MQVRPRKEHRIDLIVMLLDIHSNLGIQSQPISSNILKENMPKALNSVPVERIQSGLGAKDAQAKVKEFRS